MAPALVSRVYRGIVGSSGAEAPQFNGLAVAIMVLAIPHAEPQQSARLPLAKVQGVANPGWLHEAAKQFH